MPPAACQPLAAMRATNGSCGALSGQDWTVTWTGEEVSGLEVRSAAVAVRVCAPPASPVDGVQDHALLSDAVAVHTPVPSALMVTVASGSLVPDAAGVAVTVAPAAGAVIAAGGGKSVTLATPSPLSVTTTLCTVTCPLPLRSRKSALECC